MHAYMHVYVFFLCTHYKVTQVHSHGRPTKMCEIERVRISCKLIERHIDLWPGAATSGVKYLCVCVCAQLTFMTGL